MQVEFRVGPGQAADGATTPPRLSRMLEQVVGDGFPRYYELARLGQLYYAITATARAPGTAIVATPPFALWNPPGSGRNLAVIAGYVQWSSGTLGAGTIYWVGHPGQALAPTATTITIASGVAGGADGAARAYENVTAGGQAGVQGRPAFRVGAATSNPTDISAMLADVVDGALVVPPGTLVSLQEVGAAGTTPTVLLGAAWAELAA